MRRIVLFFCCGLMNWMVMAQTPVTPMSDWLSIDTSLVIEAVQGDLNQKNWVATTHKHKFFFCQRKAFHLEDKDYRCIINVVDMDTYRQDTISVCYPALGSSWKREAMSCCIYALSFEGENLLLVCDNQLLLYQRVKQNYKFMKRWFCFGVHTGYLHQNRVYALVDDKEKSVYHWLCYDKLSDSQGRLIRNLEQPAPFLLQFDPNRYLFADEHYLFYMPPGDCVIRKFSLQGLLLDSIRFSMPGWVPFPSNMLSELRKLTYGPERIFYALNHQYRQYSFVKTFDWLNDSLLLLSVNLGDDNRQQQLAVLRLCKTISGWRQEVSTLSVTDTGQIYSSSCYPVSFHLSADNLLVYPYQGRLLQLLLAPEKEMYSGLSVRQYRRYKDGWFKDHDPVVKLRVQSVKNEMTFYDYDNNRVSLADLKQDRVVLLVNQQLQCSACQKQLLRFLSEVDTSRVAVACLMGENGSYLARRQQLKSLFEICPRFYHPLYAVELEDYGVLYSSRTYPSVFLWQKNVGFVNAFELEDIFTADYDHYEFSEMFLNTLQHFIRDD